MQYFLVPVDRGGGSMDPPRLVPMATSLRPGDRADAACDLATAASVSRVFTVSALPESIECPDHKPFDVIRHI